MSTRRGITKAPTVLVPEDLHRELMGVSKAALADLAWDLAQAGAGEGSQEAREMIRRHLEVVLRLREQDAVGPHCPSCEKPVRRSDIRYSESTEEYACSRCWRGLNP